jgi:hypothetical protein
MSSRSTAQAQSRSNVSIVRSTLSRGIAASTIRVTLPFQGTISSSVANVINTSISLVPSGSAGNWTNLSQIYDEFRVLGARIQFFCSQQNSITVASALLVCVYDNDDATTVLTSLNQALAYREKIQFASIWDNQSFPKLTAAVNNSGDANTGALWFTCATPGQYPHSFKLYGNLLSASTQYLQYTCEIVCEFRGPV